MYEQAKELLKKYYGYDDFREGQDTIIKSILEGQDTLGIMPTGGGKSICYQIPALLLPGTTLVISPLISLMKDQVDALDSLGIPSTYINSSLTYKQVEKRINEARLGKYKLLYIAPERLESEEFFSLLQSLEVSMVAVDEAHCISQWGHDFRTSYLSIAPLLEKLSSRPVLSAFTATATPEVSTDIVKLLSLRTPNVYIRGFDRPNLSFTILRGENKKDFILHYVEANKDQAGIIYAATRKEVDSVYEFLNKKGYKAGRYHAGLSDKERARNQDEFLYDDIRIMVASNAFGMGIDKSNVRYVIHYNMPKNMEAYYQEAGRAGRDGEPSECIMLFNPQDILMQKFLIEQSFLTEERKTNEYRKLQAMVDYAHTTQCVRNYILKYFGEESTEECGRCSNCTDDREESDITVDAQKIFSCIWRMKERFGMSLVAQVLRGLKNKRILQFGFENLPTYGLLRQYTDKEITDRINVLIAEGYLTLTGGQYPVVKLAPRAVRVLKGEEKVFQKVRKKQQKIVEDNALFEQLRQLRKELSQRDNVPPYIIFPDSTLREMSEYCPTDESSMLAIKGVGEAKMKNYGQPFLELLQKYAEEHALV